MFDLDATKILIVGGAALIFIPPKDLPRVMRQAGQFVGKMKRMASEFQGQFMDAMREADMADLRREAQELSKSTRVDLGLDQLNTHMNNAIGSKPLAAPASSGSIASSAVPAAVETSAPISTVASHEPAPERSHEAAGGDATAASSQHTTAPHVPAAEPADHSV